MKTLSYIVNLADKNDARIVLPFTIDRNEQVIDITITRSDGRYNTYRLMLTAKGTEVLVKEALPNKLPSFCPQLHINSDNTFCLGWKEDTNLNIIDEETAQTWWLQLHKFLRLQERARLKKVWPTQQWAHGRAVYHQNKAEQIALLLGSDFVQDLDKNFFHTKLLKRKSKYAPLIALYRQENLIYIVSKSGKRVMNKKQACVCQKGDIKRHRRLKSCSNHAVLAAEFALAIYEWKKEEEKFWEAFKGHKCCGLMDGCQLMY
jgi:hypothetical protein